MSVWCDVGDCASDVHVEFEKAFHVPDTSWDRLQGVTINVELCIK